MKLIPTIETSEVVRLLAVRGIAFECAANGTITIDDKHQAEVQEMLLGQTSPKAKAYRQVAREFVAMDEGTYDMDDDAIVSPGDDPGAYVQIWLWVPESDLPEELQEPRE